jgi:hypothetical protein
VLKFIREGKTNAEIGVRLGVSPDAVKYHVSNMLGKLGLSTREELAGWKPSSGNPLGRLWSAVPLFGKFGIGAAAAVLAGGIAWSAVTTSTTPQLYDGLVTMGYDGKPANGNSEMLQISANGRYIVYSSWASNLVPDDTNNVPDVFRFDRETRKTELVSLGASGGVGDGPASWPSITADGRYVAYLAGSPEVPGGTARKLNVVVRDMTTGAAKSLDAVGFFGLSAISGDGRFLALTRADAVTERFLTGFLEIWDLRTDQKVWSLPVDRAVDPFFPRPGFRFSPDGHWFAFQAGVVEDSGCAPILMDAEIDGVHRDVPMQRPFIHDMRTGRTTCAPLESAPNEGRMVSLGGATDRLVAYAVTRTKPNSSELIESEVVLFEPETGEVRQFSRTGEPFFGTTDWPAIGEDSLAVVDDPATRVKGQPYGILWSMPAGGAPVRIIERPARFEPWAIEHGEPALSEDGRTLAFTVQGQDRDSGSQVSDVYVVSR